MLRFGDTFFNQLSTQKHASAPIFTRFKSAGSVRKTRRQKSIRTILLIVLCLWAFILAFAYWFEFTSIDNSVLINPQKNVYSQVLLSQAELEKVQSIGQKNMLQFQRLRALRMHNVLRGTQNQFYTNCHELSVNDCQLNKLESVTASQTANLLKQKAPTLRADW